ncbi:MAG: hypothetical protein ABS49_06775 [Erythrobacter sp. SCN 62-14]|nr:MAG: hypothetical protein ABS49_06775 [Erythrobacter sp. SCN 62-14]
MATSSEWLTALAAPLPAPAPRWFDGLSCDGQGDEALGQPTGFRPGAPFAALARAAPEPSVPDTASAPEPDPVSEPADLIKQAEARAYAEGEAAGRAAASAEAHQEIARARALRLNFRALDEAALGVLAEELAASVQALCSQVLGDYALDGAGLAARCEAAAARLGSGWAGAVLHLHPDDLAGLPEGALAGWQIAPDPALERGALVIEGPDGALRDTPADWRRALAEALRP